MALIFKADTNNLAKLEMVFPEAVAEAKARYHAPAACLSLEEWESEGWETGGNRDFIEQQIAQAKEKAGVTW